MSRQPPQPPTTGNPSSGPLSVQSILNPADPTPPAGERPQSSGAGQRSGGRRLSHPPRPSGPATLPIHPPLPQAQQLPPIRAEPPSSVSPAGSFSPRERFGQSATSYGQYNQGPPLRPGESRRPALPSIPQYAPMMQDPPEHQQQHQQRGMQQALPSGGNYQYMTIDSASGPIQIPVDVQAASRQADEKRRRNAGASARFRARRKERETASTREIDSLRQQIADITEDMEFYRSERDYLLPLIYDRDDRDRHIPRPQSPRRRRPVRPRFVPDISPPYPGEYSRASREYEEHGDRSSSERHTRRRLTQDYGSSSMSGPATYSYSQHQGQPPPPQPYQSRDEQRYDARSYGPIEPGPRIPPLQGQGLPPPQGRDPRDYQEQRPPDPYRMQPPPPPPPSQPPSRRRR